MRMPVSRYRVYEEASKIEENAFLDEVIELVWRMPKPRSWAIREPPRRPEERYWGRPSEFSWQAIVIVLLLMQYRGEGFRGISSHVRSRPELMKRLGLTKPPSKTTLHRAHSVLRQGWLESLNAQVLAGFKKRDGHRRNG